MSTTLFPVTGETTQSAPWKVALGAIDHGSDTAESTSINDPNVISKVNASDITVSTETLTTVTDLDWALAEREIFEFEYLLKWARVGTTQIELALIVPAGITVYSVFQCAHDELATPLGWCQSFQQGTGTVNKVMPIAVAGTFTEMPARIFGLAVADSAGTINLQVSKGDANSTSVTINIGSVLIARRLKS